MRICVNGTDHDVPDACTVADLLREIGLYGRPVAVEVDRSVVPYAEHTTFVLEPGVVVECVTLVGGG
jgi:thiamine biosynthesis protein ThiS